MADEKTPQQQMELEALIEKTNLALKKQVEFQSKMTRLKGEELSAAQELINKEDAKARQAQEFLDLIQQQYKTVENINKSRDSIIKSIEEERARGQMTLENYDNQTTTLNAIFDLKEKQLSANETEKAQIDAQLKSLEEQLINQQRLNKEKFRVLLLGTSWFLKLQTCSELQTSKTQ